MTISTQTRETWSRIEALLPVLLTACLYLSTTTNRGVIDYDEGHYSQAALNMAVSGDWVTPRVNGVRFLEKPPLMYWVTAASFKTFGVNEFALRLPSSLAVIALVWLVTLIGRRAAGVRTGTIAGLSLACCAGTYLFTREALHDIWLVLFVTLAMYAFFEWYLDERHTLRHALLFYAASAGAVLTKSLVGVAFPVLIVGIFFLLAREWPKWRTLHAFPGALLFLALAVPWHWLAALRNERFIYFFFINEQFLRFLGKHDPPVLWSLPVVTFWALILVWFFPWMVFLPEAFRMGRRPADHRQRALALLALAWAGGILGFFSVMARLEHYAFPALPALSLLVGLALGRINEGKSVRRALAGLALLGILILAVAVGAGAWLFASGRSFHNAPPSTAGRVYETDFSIMAEMPPEIMRRLLFPAGVTACALAAGFCAALWLEIRGRRLGAIIGVAGAMAVVCLMIHWSLVICEDMISSKRFALEVARAAPPDARLIVAGDYESANSLNFYTPLQVQVFNGVAYALIPGMKFPDAPKIVLTQQEFETAWRSPARVFALVPDAFRSGSRLGGRELLRVLDRVLISNH
jgi:4-amino-4-deoxy-L-arabinose transferase-like glycosyltransferase